MSSRKFALLAAILCVLLFSFWSFVTDAYSRNDSSNSAHRADVETSESSLASENILSGEDSGSPAAVSGSVKQGLSGKADLLVATLLSGKQFQKDDELSFDLPDGRSVVSNIFSSFVNVNGTVSITAHIVGSDFGRVFIAETNGVLQGRIRLPERNELYALEVNPRTHAIVAQQLDPNIAEPGEGPQDAVLFEPVADSSIVSIFPSFAPTPADNSVETVTVDVLMVYSNDALSAVGSETEIFNMMALAIAYGNDTHRNTGTGIELNLIHSASTDYTSEGSMSDDLSLLAMSGRQYRGLSQGLLKLSGFLPVRIPYR